MNRLTPKQAWDMYGGGSVKLFVSFFYDEGITDVKKMCRLYVQDIPFIFGCLYAQDRLDHIAKLLKQHIKNVGYDENSLYTEKELQEIWDEEANKLLSIISDWQYRTFFS